MPEVRIILPEEEAKELYRHLHQIPDGQEQFCEAYRQLQLYFFQYMTVQQVTSLLKESE